MKKTEKSSKKLNNIISKTHSPKSTPKKGYSNNLSVDLAHSVLLLLSLMFFEAQLLMLALSIITMSYLVFKGVKPMRVEPEKNSNTFKPITSKPVRALYIFLLMVLGVFIALFVFWLLISISMSNFKIYN